MRRCLHCMNIYEKEYDVCPHCGHIYDAKPELDRYLPPGTVINDRYILGTVIGSGGFGITYVAWDDLLKTKIAIKEYFPNTIAGRTGSMATVTVTGEEQTKQYHDGLVRFLDEARRIAKFNKSENIVHVHDFVETNNTAYMVMEFVEGRTLKSIIEEKKKLPVDKAIKIVAELADILDKVHKEGLLHRDISPDNISIREDGSVTLLDFGAARFFAEKETKRLSVIVKPSYAPPEQYLYDNKQDKRTDVYALGAVLYHMITGKKPQEATGRLMEDNLLRPSEINKEVPVWLDACILKAVCLKANDRFKDMAEFKSALDENKCRTFTANNDSPKEKRNLKERKNLSKKGTITIALLIIILLSFISVGVSSQNKTTNGAGEKTKGESEAIIENTYVKWGELLMSEELPKPGFDDGVEYFAYSNNEKGFNATIESSISSSMFSDYKEICEKNGYNMVINADREGDEWAMYEAYNSDGNWLKLEYYESQLTIELAVQTFESEINWPDNNWAAMLPKIDSAKGNIIEDGEEYDFLEIYVSNISYDEFDAYVKQCIDKGFKVGSYWEYGEYNDGTTFYARDVRYDACDQNENHLWLTYYEEFNAMNIQFHEPFE